MWQWNLTRCKPPWSEAELRRIIENAWKYGQNPPGSKVASGADDDSEDSTNGESVKLDTASAAHQFLYQPFPVEALPEPLRAYVTGGAKALGCDPANIALPLLASAGAAIGNTYRVELKSSWREPPIIWTLVPT